MTRFLCSVCKREYHTREEAAKCVKQGWRPEFEPGDIVVELCALGKHQTGEDMEDGPYTRFGWYDGESLWIFKDFDFKAVGGERHGYAPYFVVGSVTADWPHHPHEPVYHLFTEAFKNGKRGFRGGQTMQKRHYPMAKIADPPAELVAASRKFVGMTTNQLL